MRGSRSILATFVIVITTASLSLAQTSQPVDNLIHRTAGSGAVPATQSSTSTALDTGRVVLALAAVLGLILLLRAGIRRFAPGAVGRSSRGVRVISRTYLGPKQQVIVLQVGRRLVVVGNTGQHLTTLCEITDPDEAALLLAQIQGTSPDSSREAFSQVMNRAEEQFAPLPSTAPANDPALDSARSELNGLAERVRVLAKHLKKA